MLKDKIQSISITTRIPSIALSSIFKVLIYMSGPEDSKNEKKKA